MPLTYYSELRRSQNVEFSIKIIMYSKLSLSQVQPHHITQVNVHMYLVKMKRVRNASY
jgi:hypothetical protein